MMTPSAPPLESASTANGNYVNFVVVLNSSNNSEPISAKKSAVDASEGLRRIINEKNNCDNKGNHIIRGVAEDDFKLLIEFLETKKIPLKDQNQRLQMFSVAKLYNCPELMVYCLREVDANLNVSNVLTVYRTLWFYGSLTSQKNPMDKKSKDKKKTYSPEEYLTFLVYNVLQFINMNAENVMLADELEELGFKELENLVKQDDLILHSEMVLINALTRWSRAECRRKNLELTHENERRVLGELCYAPRFVALFTRWTPEFSDFFFDSTFRYLTLKPCEFELACKNIRYLDPAEITLIREAFDGKKSNLTVEQSNMLNDFRKQRPKYARMPINLSPRSHRRNYPRNMRRNDRSSKEGSSCFIDCLACLLCVCD